MTWAKWAQVNRDKDIPVYRVIIFSFYWLETYASCPTVQIAGPSYCEVLPKSGCEPSYVDPEATTQQPGTYMFLQSDTLYEN